MMRSQGLVVIAGGLPKDLELAFDSKGLLLVGVPPLWELCYSLATSNDEVVLGNAFEGGGVLKE